MSFQFNLSSSEPQPPTLRKEFESQIQQRLIASNKRNKTLIIKLLKNET